MQRPQSIAPITPLELDEFANDLAMTVWNAIAKLPQFGHLEPQDYPPVYEAVLRALKEKTQ